MVIPHLSKILDNIDPEPESGHVFSITGKVKNKTNSSQKSQELIANLTQLATADLSVVERKILSWW